MNFRQRAGLLFFLTAINYIFITDGDKVTNIFVTVLVFSAFMFLWPSKEEIDE